MSEYEILAYIIVIIIIFLICIHAYNHSSRKIKNNIIDKANPESRSNMILRDVAIKTIDKNVSKSAAYLAIESAVLSLELLSSKDSLREYADYIEEQIGLPKIRNSKIIKIFMVNLIQKANNKTTTEISNLLGKLDNQLIKYINILGISISSSLIQYMNNYGVPDDINETQELINGVKLGLATVIESLHPSYQLSLDTSIIFITEGINTAFEELFDAWPKIEEKIETILEKVSTLSKIKTVSKENGFFDEPNIVLPAVTTTIGNVDLTSNQIIKITPSADSLAVASQLVTHYTQEELVQQEALKLAGEDYSKKDIIMRNLVKAISLTKKIAEASVKYVSPIAISDQDFINKYISQYSNYYSEIGNSETQLNTVIKILDSFLSGTTNYPQFIDALNIYGGTGERLPIIDEYLQYMSNLTNKAKIEYSLRLLQEEKSSDEELSMYFTYYINDKKKMLQMERDMYGQLEEQLIGNYVNIQISYKHISTAYEEAIKNKDLALLTYYVTLIYSTASELSKCSAKCVYPLPVSDTDFNNKFISQYSCYYECGKELEEQLNYYVRKVDSLIASLRKVKGGPQFTNYSKFIDALNLYGGTGAENTDITNFITYVNDLWEIVSVEAQIRNHESNKTKTLRSLSQSGINPQAIKLASDVFDLELIYLQEFYKFHIVSRDMYNSGVITKIDRTSLDKAKENYKNALLAFDVARLKSVLYLDSSSEETTTQIAPTSSTIETIPVFSGDSKSVGDVVSYAESQIKVNMNNSFGPVKSILSTLSYPITVMNKFSELVDKLKYGNVMSVANSLTDPSYTPLNPDIFIPLNNALSKAAIDFANFAIPNVGSPEFLIAAFQTGLNMLADKIGVNIGVMNDAIDQLNKFADSTYVKALLQNGMTQAAINESINTLKTSVQNAQNTISTLSNSVDTMKNGLGSSWSKLSSGDIGGATTAIASATTDTLISNASALADNALAIANQAISVASTAISTVANTARDLANAAKDLLDDVCSIM